MSKFRDLYIRERRDHELAKTKLVSGRICSFDLAAPHSPFLSPLSLYLPYPL